MKLAVLCLLFISILSVVISDSTAEEVGVTHLWNEFQFVGFHGGAYDLGDRNNGLFAGVNGFYNTYLEHRRRGGVIAHFNSLGILGTLNYYFESAEITMSGFITSGYYPTKDTLFQWGVGPAYSDNFGTGVSAILHSGYAYDKDYAFAFFFQTDYFGRDSTQFLLGISLGFGSLKSYQ